jgi:ribonuclease D|tara:strand:- start:714 stop:1337 length:624 start_codon:yes stop_codon:yes gene_type:complete
MKINTFSNDLPKEIISKFKDSVAIDVESTGLKIPERDKLSLIQLCNKEGEVFIIQPDRKHYNCPNLVSILENKKTKKYFHFARFDVSALNFFLKTKVSNYDCSKLKSFLTRTYTDQHGLKNLVLEFCNKNLDKRQGSSDWNKNINELSEKQLEYAAHDSYFLHKIHYELDKILVRENRLELYKKCIEFLDTRIELDQKGFKFDVFSH